MKGILLPLMKKWSDKILEFGNEAAYPKPNIAAKLKTRRTLSAFRIS
jgi:hypothetical protein